MTKRRSVLEVFFVSSFVIRISSFPLPLTPALSPEYRGEGERSLLLGLRFRLHLRLLDLFTPYGDLGEVAGVIEGADADSAGHERLVVHRQVGLAVEHDFDRAVCL